MSTPSLYTDGTLSVEAAATAVTGHSTAWSTQLKRGTQIVVAGVAGTVASVETDTALTLAAPWAGATAVTAAYVATTWNDGAEIAESIRLMMERIVGRGMGVVVAGVPVAADHRDNDIVFSRASGTLYVKDQGVMTALLAPGNYDAFGYTNESPSDRDQYDDGQGDLAEAVGSNLTFFAINEGGFYILLTPTFESAPAVWSDLVTVRGPAGSSDVTGTSASSVAIGTGSKGFTVVEADRGWAVGARLRLSSDANPAVNYMEGVVTAYSGTALTVLVDLIGGSGTLADWTINLAGQVGALTVVELDARYNLNALQIVNNLGLGTNLHLCLDAGAIASSPGSGTKWLDISGNGYDFDYGDGSTATTRPTFNGNAGGKSLREYLGLDGGDYLTYDSANETWMDALHKDNAIFTGIFWVYRSAAATFDTLIGTRAGNTGGNVGVVVNISSADILQFIQRNGTTNQTVAASTFVVGSGAWEMFSFSINEATGASGLILGKNLTFETFTSTYTSPSASAATSRLNIGQDGTATASGLWPNGSRFGMGLMWSGTALTQAQIAAFFHATRDRYGV